MKKKKNFKQISASTLLFLAGLFLGLAVGLLLIPKTETVPVETPVTPMETAPASIAPPFLGNEKAKVQIVEYTDFECPFCREYYKNVFSGLMREYIERGQIGYTFKDFPLQQYKNNIDASLTAYCAAEQDNFWPMHTFLFEEQKTWEGREDAKVVFKNFAQDLALDMNAFDACHASQKYFQTIQKNIDTATPLNIKVTPTVFVNDIRIEGLQTAEYYKQVIDAEIQRTSTLSE